MQIIDLHCDTILEGYISNQLLRKNNLKVDLEKLKEGHALAQFFALFLPSGCELSKYKLELNQYELFNKLYNYYDEQIKANEDIIRPALNADDIEKNFSSGHISSVLTIEDGGFLDGKIERLGEVYDKGVRLITLTWNYENCIGYPASSDNERHQMGLKTFGFEVVEKMNELGIIVDVSHLSEGGFDDVASVSQKPFVASHSCAQALCSHSRNLSDRQLRIISESGGLVGVNYFSKFLRNGSDYASIADIVAHIDHMLNVMGTDHVSFGSDFDGIDCKLEIKDYRYYGLLIDELLKKHPLDTVEKLCNKNVSRVLRECL